MKIPVILLNYNSSADCKKCVTFLKQQQGIELEIVIVDNCSQMDESVKVKELSEKQGCTFIQAHENRGYNAGNNIGLRYAAEKGYKYVLIANPDMEFPQVDYIGKLVDCMQQDSKIVIVGSDIVTPSGMHQNPMREMTYHEELWWGSTLLKNRKNHRWFNCNHTQSGVCEKLSGCCFLIDLNFVRQIGYFDENVFLYSEESILAKQVHIEQKKMYYCANAQAIHRHIKGEKGNPHKRMQILFRSREYYLRNYSGYRGFKFYILLLSKRLQGWLYDVCI